MMRSLRAVVLIGAAVFVLPALAGCLQFEQAGILLPDGSGKLVMKVGLKKSTLKLIEELARQFGGDAKPSDPLADLGNPSKLQENSEGIVAWSEPKKEEDADWAGATVVGYFEDINKVKIYTQADGPDGQKQKKLSFACKVEKTDAGHVLTLSNDGSEELKKFTGPGEGQGNEELGKAVLEMMRPMLEGLKVTYSVTVPGPIQEATGFTEKKDRTATIAIDGKAILDAMKDPQGAEAKKLKALGESKGGRIVWRENAVPPADVEAFKKELETAKERWAKILEEHKKK